MELDGTNFVLLWGTLIWVGRMKRFVSRGVWTSKSVLASYSVQQNPVFWVYRNHKGATHTHTHCFGYVSRSGKRGKWKRETS